MSDGIKLNFFVSKDKLLQALSYINSIVEKRHSIVVLSCVRIEARDQEIKLTSTDLDISIIASITAHVNVNGVVVVSAQLLYDIVKKLPNDIEIKFFIGEDGRLTIKCGRTEFFLPVVDIEKFPIIENNELQNKFTLQVSELVSLFGKTKFAISIEESRFNLNGLYVHTSNNILCCAATDGHRLSLTKLSQSQNVLSNFGIIVPKKTVNEILKIVSHGSGNDLISISLSDRKICFEYKEYILISKVIDGTFPDYNSIIPRSHDKNVLIESETLSNAIDRVSVVVFDKVKVIKLRFVSNKLILSAASSDQGDAREELEVDYSGEDMTIGLNARYLMEALYCIKGKCLLSFYDAGTSVLIQEEENIDDFTYIIMPMRI
ncbi:DNA polymerase III, beta subunit [Ehrlichia chaffeensis str. Liberty]|uniref:Beta sliding clamp n=1 Tax=Ehrlichia chaffeensis TaxID=945 RepID=Q4PLX0_EHRCH|nr:DNA polymerase III subunit beta [Ehrlichia chaffeensis]AAY79411.1 DNA polymerase beta subunit [Ehrlichia chaffeensis]AHX06230.1 DNA polymerase III, beta subunit [Ehrlichia chaffeensis str. Liberty]AHX07772.1 DNA polymerase III, beta subunit [Ehrlichia chaffeensis str. Osceola]AHX08732.1 DNA polymerase III, beta subunit [Ehrlichia chaffeensis str. Saint Vincent]AHX09921.1 DNA polymerase III, beta subunit [Ehrlichia chaffeensis str. Wakulla]